jgi:Fur family peroxide stress response transcriptional regulator
MGQSIADQTDSIIQTLKAHGLRVTPQRFAVYANLKQRADHPTVEQLFHDLNQNAPISSQSTIYSSLQALCEVGLVRAVLLDEGVCRYDANVAPHHHFRCQCCGKIEDILWDELPDINMNHFQPRFQVSGYEVTLYGLCEECR